MRVCILFVRIYAAKSPFKIAGGSLYVCMYVCMYVYVYLHVSMYELTQLFNLNRECLWRVS